MGRLKDMMMSTSSLHTASMMRMYTVDSSVAQGSGMMNNVMTDIRVLNQRELCRFLAANK